MGFLDAELSLEESDFTGLPAGNTMVAWDGAAANAVDVGPGPHGPSPLFLLMQVVDAFTIGAGVDVIWFTLVSRATTPNLTVNQWTPHVQTRQYAHTALTAGTWLEPLLIPSSAARYLSYLCSATAALTAGSIRALLVRGYEQPYGMQVIPTP